MKQAGFRACRSVCWRASGSHSRPSIWKASRQATRAWDSQASRFPARRRGPGEGGRGGWFPGWLPTGHPGRHSGRHPGRRQPSAQAQFSFADGNCFNQNIINILVILTTIKRIPGVFHKVLEAFTMKFQPPPDDKISMSRCVCFPHNIATASGRQKQCIRLISSLMMYLIRIIILQQEAIDVGWGNSESGHLEDTSKNV